MKDMANEKKIEILNAYNEYSGREFDNNPCATLEDALYDGCLLGIAYTEYYDDDSFDYDDIQVGYDFDAEAYKIFLGYGNREECIEIACPVDGLIDDLKWYDFENFIDIDGNYNNYNKA